MATFTDDFNRTDRDLAGDNGWTLARAAGDTSSTGKLSIISSKVLAEGYAPNVFRSIGPTTELTVQVTATAYPGEQVTPRLWWSHTAMDQTADGYFAQLSTGTNTLKAYKRVNGTLTVLVDVPITGDAQGVFKVTRSGNVHTIYEEGTNQLAQFTDSDVNGDYVGFGSGSTTQRLYFDNYTTTYTPTTTPVDTRVTSPESAGVTGTTAGAPADAPVLTATGGLNQIALSWNAVTNADGYHVHRDDGFLLDVVGTSYTNTGLAHDRTHSYWIIPYNTAGDGPTSNVATATTDEFEPAPNITKTGLSGAAPVQQAAFLDTLVNAVDKAQGVANGALVGSAVPCALVRRGLSLANDDFLTIDPASTSVAFLQGTTVLWTQELSGPLVAETIALTFGEL